MAYLDDAAFVLNIQPIGLPTIVRLSQNENGRRLYFTIIGNETAIPSGVTVTLSGTKPDGVVYSKVGSISNGVVLINEDTQLTAAAGNWDAKIKIVSGGQTVATGRVRFIIDADPVAPGSVPSDSQLEGLVAEAEWYAENARSAAYGSPLVASTVAGMTDHTRVYVYTGSETGYTAGNWYYWNGSAWTSGGVYNSTALQTDTTLAIPGMAADAKSTGDAIGNLDTRLDTAEDDITDVKSDLSDLDDKIDQVFTDEAKENLIAILKKAVYLSDAEELIEALEDALITGPVTIGPRGIIEITNAKAGIPIALTLDVSPVQDLHGYGYPWSAGKGKNIIPYYPNKSASGITMTVDSFGIVTVSGTATATFLNGSNFTLNKDAVYYVLASPSMTNAGITIRDSGGGVLNDNGIVFGTADFNGESGRISCTQNNYGAQCLYRVASGATPSGQFSPMVIKEGENNHLSSKFSSGTKDGLSFSVGSDGVITVNGTASDTVVYGVSVFLPAGEYVIAGNRHINIELYDQEGGSPMSEVSGFTGDDTVSHRGGVFAIDQDMTIFVAFSVSAGTYTNRNVYPVLCDRIETDLNYAPYSNICPLTKINSITMKHGVSASSYQSESFDTSQINYYGGTIDFVAQKLKRGAYYSSYAGETISGVWQSSMDKYEPGTFPTVGAEVVDMGNLADTVVSVGQISLLEGANRLWSDNGLTTLTYEKK